MNMKRPVIFWAPSSSHAIMLAAYLGARARALVASHSPEERLLIVEGFFDGQFDIIVATESFCTGWRAPKGTVMVYIEGFTEEKAVRIQAAARAAI